MNIYFDTEFTSLQKDSTLISIGLISEDNREFYAEINNLIPEKQDRWIIDNVLKNTVNYGNIPIRNIIKNESNFVSFNSDTTELNIKLTKWLSQFDNIQLVSDVCHYDMIHFINIFGGAFDLPKNVAPCCHDINQDIANYFWITDAEAFDISREQLLEEYGIVIPGTKHNSLYDAKVIKYIYNQLHQNTY